MKSIAKPSQVPKARPDARPRDKRWTALGFMRDQFENSNEKALIALDEASASFGEHANPMRGSCKVLKCWGRPWWGPKRLFLAQQTTSQSPLWSIFCEITHGNKNLCSKSEPLENKEANHSEISHGPRDLPGWRDFRFVHTSAPKSQNARLAMAALNSWVCRAQNVGHKRMWPTLREGPCQTTWRSSRLLLGSEHFAMLCIAAGICHSFA